MNHPSFENARRHDEFYHYTDIYKVNYDASMEKYNWTNLRVVCRESTAIFFISMQRILI